MNERRRAEILFANERFYTAFAAGDTAEMEALWSDAGPVVCLHPGWEPLTDRSAVMESWQAILGNPPPVRCLAPEILPLGETAAAVICWEAIGGDRLIATNLFRLEDGAWHLVHHQAGPTRGTPPEPTGPAAPGRAN
jgi:hypothetical protein